jgi:hypothetical protein
VHMYCVLQGMIVGRRQRFSARANHQPSST